MTSKKWQRAGLLLLAALPVAAVTAAWLLHRWHRLGESGAYFFGAVGNLFGLIGLPLLVVMAALGTRLPLVERVFGLDRMMRAHKLLAKAVVSLFLAHALLRTLKLSMTLGEGWQWGFLFSMDWSHWGMAAGRLSLYALLVLSPLALVGGLWVPWRVWKSGHLLLYPALVLGFVHARAVGDDIAKFPYNAVWYALAVVAAAVLLYRVVYRVLRGRRCTWLVERTERETHDTTSLVLSRAAGLGAFAARRAGQFATLRVRRPVGWSEPHPFTVASAPGGDGLRFTIKASGDFSATTDLATAKATIQPKSRGWVEFPLDAAVTAPFAWVWLPPAEGISWHRMGNAPLGSARAYGGDGHWTVVKGQYYAVFTKPALAIPADYRVENVTNGVTRIIGEATNLWASDPEQSMPQWLQLTFGQPTKVNAVYLTFDTDMNAPFHTVPVVAECVRDYDLAVHNGAGWTTVATVKGNFQRRRVHRFGAVAATKLRLTIHATNGSRAARLFELRAYHE